MNGFLLKELVCFLHKSSNAFYETFSMEFDSALLYQLHRG
jgi:hypothetical protein